MIAMLQRVRGCALLQLGRYEEGGAALAAGVDEARRRSAEYELSLALDGLAALARETRREPLRSIEEERDAILARLGVVRIPEIPVKKRPVRRSDRITRPAKAGRRLRGGVRLLRRANGF